MNDLALLHQGVFLLLSAVILAGAVGVAISRTVFGSALWLVLALLGVAGIYMTLGASFLAVVQILVYVGAITVLILFAVMLTPQVMGEGTQFNSQWSMGIVVALMVFGILAVLSYQSNWPLAAGDQALTTGTLFVSHADEPEAATLAAAVPGATTELDAHGAERVRVPGTIERIGRGFMIDFLLPFELISVILLVALVGAIAIARD